MAKPFNNRFQEVDDVGFIVGNDYAHVGYYPSHGNTRHVMALHKDATMRYYVN
jgi:hypothetical protein